MSSKHILPSKIPSYLRRLELEYRRSARTDLSQVIRSSRLWVEEETEYDNWNGGVFGHDVVLFLPPEIIGRISLEAQERDCDRIREDFRKCTEAVPSEYVRSVFFEIFDDSDSKFQKALPFAERPQIDPDLLTIWRAGFLRVFISHRDSHKVAARKLADALEPYGVSAFVAHDTIQPMTTWQHEIMRGLDTMEIMIAFITDDFHESTWTNQEIGFALGKNIPIVPLKFEHKDPAGFIGTIQAQRGRLDDASTSVGAVYKILAEKLGQRSRLQQTLISAFTKSPDFTETKNRFDRMSEAVDSLSDAEVAVIIAGFRHNDQLHNAAYLTSKYARLQKFLERCTSRKFGLRGNAIVDLSKSSDSDKPF